MQNYLRGYFFILLISFLQLSTIVKAQSYKLIWSDEFNGPNIDPSVWTHETGGNGWGNGEWEYYTDRSVNSYIDNGVLVIKAIKENYGNMNYTSARLITRGKKFFKYGKIEARIKLPYGKGIWPAFWMMGENINSMGWPSCGENDIMEMTGGESGDSRVYGTLHWSNNGQHAQSGGYYDLSSGKFADGFHIFAVTWSPQKIVWSVDDHTYYTIDITPEGLKAFQNDFFILLNLAVGGQWPGYPDATTIFPQTMEVDYVRVYQDTSSIPDISVTSPGNNSSFDAHSDITITADASLTNGNLGIVQFYQDAVKIGETDVKPYQIIWRNVYPGNYKIYAKTSTDLGYESTSQFININVGSGSSESPYMGHPFSIPGTIETENYDLGGQNVSYYDSDISNNGKAYRTDDVDIESCIDDGGGYDVGWNTNNEWLNYLVEVKKTGTFEISARVASNSTGGEFNITIGDHSTGNIKIPNTGGWQTWSTVTSPGITLRQGIYNMKFTVISGAFNINRFEIYEPGTQPRITITSPNGGEKWQTGTIQEIRWNSLKVSNVKIGLSSDGGKNWTSIANTWTSGFGSYRWKVNDVTSSNCKIMVVDENNLTNNDVSDAPFSIAKITNVDNKKDIPEGFTLQQNYPNPFNPTTNIRYSIHDKSFVSIKVFDNLGNRVSTLINEEQSAGTYNLIFRGDNLASGVYFYSLEIESIDGKIAHRSVRKMLLLK